MILKIVSEFIATFLLVFVGTAAIVFDQTNSECLTNLGIATVFGVMVFSLILFFGKISGAHINPAVTISLWLARQLDGKLVILYLFSQILGAVWASATLKKIFPQSETLGMTQAKMTYFHTFLLEFVLTFLLMVGIFMMRKKCSDNLLARAFVVGLIVFFEAWFAGPLTGASMNPARSLAPALVSNHLSGIWLYLIAPIAGATTSVLFFGSKKQSNI